MKRWQALIWLIFIFVLVGGVSLIIYTRQTGSDESPVEDLAEANARLINSIVTSLEAELDVNPNGRFAPSGSPLAVVSPEDVVVSQYEFGQNIFTLRYDYQSKNWQLEFILENALRQLRYIDSSQQFFLYNIIDKVWDEVDPSILNQELLDLTDVEQFLYSDQLFTDFHQFALEEESISCKNDTSLCATWTAEDFNNAQEIVIYVSLRSRKIDQIITLNQSNPRENPLVSNYLYQTLDIKSPNPDEARYLLD